MSSQVKSSQLIVFFRSLVLSFVLLFGFSVAAFADLIYITGDGCSVNYLTQDSSGKFIESKDVLPKLSDQSEYPYYREIYSFKKNNLNRILVTRRDAHNDTQVMIYDPENFSSPLVSKNISDISAWHGHSGGLAEFGNSIIIGKGNAIYEINPETCAFIGEPYLISDNSDDELDLIVHEGLIFVGEAIIRGNTFKFEIMDKLGNVTGSVSDFYPEDLISSGKNLYFYDNYEARSNISSGVYSLDYNGIKNGTLTLNDFLSSYAKKVVDGQVAGFCSDGEGGFYYVPTDKVVADILGRYDANDYTGNRVCHYDGTKSTEVYSDSNSIFGNVGYDPASETLFLQSIHVVGEGRDADQYVDSVTFTILKKNSNGEFELVQTLENMDSDEMALISKISSSSEPEDEKQENEKQDEPKQEEPTITTPEQPTIDTTSKDVQDNVKKTLGITDSTTQIETISEDSSIMSKEKRSEADVENEIPDNEKAALIFPLIKPTRTRIYIVKVSYEDLLKYVDPGDPIYVVMTNIKSTAFDIYNSASIGAKIIDDKGNEITKMPTKAEADSKGINVAGLMTAGGSYSTVITTDAEEEQQDTDPEQEEQNNDPGHAGTSCNGGFGFFASAFLVASLLCRRYFNDLGLRRG